MQNELAVSRGEAARNSSDLELAKADQQALLRSKELSTEALEANLTELQRTTANLLAEKAALQNQVRALEGEKCQLCVQVGQATMI